MWAASSNLNKEMRHSFHKILKTPLPKEEGSQEQSCKVEEGSCLPDETEEQPEVSRFEPRA